MGQERCRAHTTRGRCKRWPTRGATVCRSHGAGIGRVKAAAARRVAEAQLRGALAQLDVPAVGDPFSELAKVAGQVVAWKDQLAAKVNELVELRYEATGAGTEQLRAEVALFERALDRCAQVLGMIAKLNIDDRMARISERQAEAVLGAIDAAFAHAGVVGPAATDARKVAARHLRVAA